MAFNPISPSEIDFIFKGVEEGFRNDGRSNFDFREFSLVTGVISQTYGSSRCRLGNIGLGTDVLVGIKAEIGTWQLGQTDLEDKGKVVVNVDISPTASQQFISRTSDDYALELSQLLSRVISGPQGGLDLKQLCIIPKQAYWILYIDALVLGYDGNVIDTLIYSTRAALCDTLLPKVVVESVIDEDTNSEHLAFEIVDDPEAVTRLTGCEDIPLSVTLYVIGSRFVTDATFVEEVVSTARVTVCTNRHGSICSIQKGYSKTGFPPSLLTEMLGVSKQLSIDLIPLQDSLIDSLRAINLDSSNPETSMTFLNKF
ncbi:putative exosome complex exonuclease RRP42 [Smittium mucronatum]|uniref:Ribosomal RNA-processing protein 42 n=1 Tax=Smittium mucronatum TaxID=133383 RepID=A0A1R0GP52_9FUNG|nr:putative exosome complex exonuclease RRP42 [Smittium mucronatum]